MEPDWRLGSVCVSDLCCAESSFQFELTLAGGAPAGDGTHAEGGQRSGPDVNGSDQVIEAQWLLQLQQGQVVLFGARAVVVMVDDARDSNHLEMIPREPFSQILGQTGLQICGSSVVPAVQLHEGCPGHVFQPERSTKQLCCT